MKKILIIALLLMFVVTSAFATGISWFGQSGSGRIGLGVSKDGLGFIAFEDIDGALTYLYADANKGNLYGLTHKICIAHGPALFTTHSPNTEAGYFNVDRVGRPLRHNTTWGD